MVVTGTITIQSRGFCDAIDVTAQVEQRVASSGVRSGVAVVFVKGSTAGVSTMEYEPGLISDLPALFDRIVPKNVAYKHDATWGDGNGFSHLRATLMGPSVSIPILNGNLALGTWQQIIVVDFDNRPRRRDVLVQIVGE